jgi:hypothetical protein
MDDTELQTCLDVIEAKKPLGDWVDKPAIGTSTTPVTNESPYTMYVTITGGTLTAPTKVDGVAQGALTTGTFRVRSGSTIAWTGSAAPTWQWFF